MMVKGWKGKCQAKGARPKPKAKAAQPWPSTFPSPRTTSRSVALTTVRRSGCEGYLVARQARKLGQAIASRPRATSRPVVMTTVRRSGREDALAMWRFSKVKGATA
uniref:Uncharacterized protein n=1 Tax=Solanum tuberosum TaxID=4113 RepID=M1DDG6_SOLTU